MLGIGGGAAAEEVEAEPAPGFRCVEIAIDVLALEFLAFEEFGHGLHLLPGFRHAPLALIARVLPGLGEPGVRENVGAIIEIVAVAVDGDAIRLAVPGADGWLQVIDIVVDIDLLLDPVRHLRGEPLAAHVALERCPHLENVEVDRAGRNRLLQTRVVVGLREVDPGNFRAGIGLPRLEKAAEQEVMQVLVIEPHERELDTLELAGLHVRLGRTEAELAHLLPIGISRSPLPNTRDLRDLRAQGVVRPRRRGQRAKPGGGTQRSGANGALENGAAVWSCWGMRLELPVCHHETSHSYILLLLFRYMSPTGPPTEDSCSRRCCAFPRLAWRNADRR